MGHSWATRYSPQNTLDSQICATCTLQITQKKENSEILQRFRYSYQHPTQQINLLQLLAITMRNQSIFFRAELKLHSKELAQLSG